MNARARKRWEDQKVKIGCVLDFYGWVNELTNIVCEYIKPWAENVFIPLSAIDVYPGSLSIHWDGGCWAKVEIDGEPVRILMRGRLFDKTSLVLDTISDGHERQCFQEFLSTFYENLPHGAEIKDPYLMNWNVQRSSPFLAGDQVIVEVELYKLLHLLPEDKYYVYLVRGTIYVYTIA